MISQKGYQSLRRNFRSDASRATAELTEAVRSGELKPAEFSLRQLAEHLVEDGAEWVRTMDPRFGAGSYQEAAGAVSTTHFSNITGQIVYSRMLEAYQAEELFFSAIVPTVSTQFDGERIPGIGGLGDLAEVVEENDKYPLVGVSEDWIDTPRTKNRGFVVPVSKSAIFFDRTGLVLKRAGEVGEYLAINKEIRLIDAIVDENTTDHRYKWKGTVYGSYQTATPWVNVKTSNGLVDWSDIDAALKVASDIVDPNTGLPIVAVGGDLIVTPQLVAQAGHALNVTQVTINAGGYATSGNLSASSGPSPVLLNLRGYTPAAYRICTSRYLPGRMATKTHWYLGDIARAVNYFENWPLTVTQAPPNSEAEFMQDIVVRFKASERGTAAVVDPRYLVNSRA